MQTKPQPSELTSVSPLFSHAQREAGLAAKITIPLFQCECEWNCVYTALYCADATTSNSSHQPHQNPSASSSSVPELGE